MSPVWIVRMFDPMAITSAHTNRFAPVMGWKRAKSGREEQTNGEGTKWTTKPEATTPR